MSAEKQTLFGDCERVTVQETASRSTSSYRWWTHRAKESRRTTGGYLFDLSRANGGEGFRKQLFTSILLWMPYGMVEGLKKCFLLYFSLIENYICVRLNHNWIIFVSYLTKEKALCPLCKKSFTSILHNVDAMNGYDEFKIKPTREEVSLNPLEYIFGPFEPTDYE